MKEQLNKVISELQDRLKKNEQEANSSSKSLTAMQAVSYASTEKLGKLEAEIAAKRYTIYYHILVYTPIHLYTTYLTYLTYLTYTFILIS